MIGTRAGATEVVGAGGSIQLGRVRSAALAPDARAVLVETTTAATFSGLTDEQRDQLQSLLLAVNLGAGRDR